MKIKKNLFTVIVCIIIISISSFVMAGMRSYNFIAFSGLFSIFIFDILMFYFIKKNIIHIKVIE